MFTFKTNNVKFLYGFFLRLKCFINDIGKLHCSSSGTEVVAYMSFCAVSFVRLAARCP